MRMPNIRRLGVDYMTVKELKEILNNVENENVDVVFFEDQFGRAEIDEVIGINSNECVELLGGCELLKEC